MPDTRTELTPGIAAAFEEAAKIAETYHIANERDERDNARNATATLIAASIRAAATAQTGAQKYLVWSNEHKAWWGKDRCGYTRIIANAGRYDRDEALSIAGTRDGGWRLNKGNPDEIAVPEQDAIDQYADITRAQQAGAPA